ncbi:S-layer homology domain-containing protein [Candidatus Dojkabacteria bacterium]|nr:S-layer homology domain-containing protein [Candidatus Dojkabacteria bacterium]
MKKYILHIVLTSVLTLIIVLGIVFSLKTEQEDIELDIETLSEDWINPYSSLYYKYCIPLNPYSSDINVINNPYGSYFYRYPIVGNPYGSIFNQYKDDIWAYGSLYSKYDQFKDNGYAYYMNNPYGSTYKKYAGYDYGMNDSYASLFVDYCYFNNPYSSLYMKYKYPTFGDDFDYNADIDIEEDINLDLAPNKTSFKLSESVEFEFGEGEDITANFKIKLDNKEVGKLRYIEPLPTPVSNPVVLPIDQPIYINPDYTKLTASKGTNYVEVEGDLVALQRLISNMHYLPIKFAPNRIVLQIDVNKDGTPEATGYIDIQASPTIALETLIDFKNVNLNSPVVKEVEIFNTKSKDVTKINNIELSQDQNFKIIEKADSCKVGTSLIANKKNSCKIYIEFNPQVKSPSVSNNIKLTFDNAADAKIDLTGVAVFKIGSKSQTRHNSSKSNGSSIPKPTVTPKVINCNKPFNDVECDNKLISYITDLKTKKIAKGNSGGNFLPSTNVTRAEIATFIVNGFGFDGEFTESKFWDVNPSRTHHNNILLLSELGIVGGYSDGSFRPDQIVKREEVAKFIVNALKVKGLNVPENRVLNFTDITADNKFRVYIAYLTTEKVGPEYIMSGTVNANKQKVFNPSDNITREQMAKIISNSVKKIN